MDASDAATDPDAADAEIPTGPVVHCAPTVSAVGAPNSSLGHQNGVIGTWRSENAVLTQENIGKGFILWNAATGEVIANRQTGTIVGFSASVFAVLDDTLEIRSSTSGAVLGTIALGTNTLFGLAIDGSYAWGTSPTALTVWSTAGVVVKTHPGAYATSTVFGAVGELRIARGAAGLNVIEHVPSAAGGSATTSPAYNGTFAGWFTDGESFFSRVGLTELYVYSHAASQQKLLTTSMNARVAGTGDVFVTRPSTGETPLHVYRLSGNTQTVATYNGTVLTVTQGLREDLPLWLLGPIAIAELSTTVANPRLGVRSGPSSSAWDEVTGLWSAGTPDGLVYVGDGGAMPTVEGVFGCGTVRSLSGSTSGSIAFSTTLGLVFVIDVATGTTTTRFDLDAHEVQLSADASVLAVSNETPGARFLRAYTLPSATPTFAKSYGATGPQLFDFALARSGTRIARVETTGTGTPTFDWFITTLADEVIIAVEDATPGAAPVLSPSGVHAAWPGPIGRVATPFPSFLLYEDASLVSAIEAFPVGFMSDDLLLVQSRVYSSPSSFTWRTTTYDNDGIVIGHTMVLPEVTQFEVAGATRILTYANIYDIVTGAVHWTSVPLAKNTIAGNQIVSVHSRSIVPEAIP